MNLGVSVSPRAEGRNPESRKCTLQSHHGASGHNKTHGHTWQLFLVCVNLIIQIFIYTVRKNLLIFISSQTPQGPTTHTHPAYSLHTPGGRGSHCCSRAHQGHKGKDKQGGVGWGSSAFLSPGNPTILSRGGSDWTWGAVYSHAHSPP